MSSSTTGDRGSPQAQNWSILTAGVVVLSAGSIFARLAGTHPLVTACLRCAFAFLILLVWGLIKGRGKLEIPASAKERKLAALSGFFLAVHLGAWIASLDLTSVALSLLILSTAPLWTLLAGVALKLEKGSAEILGAVALSLAGITLLALFQWGAGGRFEGMLLALLSALAMSAYTLCARARGDSPGIAGYAMVVCVGAALWLVAACLIGGLNPVRVTPAAVGWIGAMAFGSQVIGHTTVNWAAGRMSGVAVGQTLLLEPIVASCLAWLVFREAVGWQTALGGALVLGGAIWSLRAHRAPQESPD